CVRESRLPCKRRRTACGPTGPFRRGTSSTVAPNPTFSTRGKNRAKSIGVYRKSPLQSRDLRASGPLRGRDARRWLRRQIELELLEQQLLVGMELGVAAEDQRAS